MENSLEENSKGKLTLSRTLIMIFVPSLLIIISIYFYIFNSRYISTDDAIIQIGTSSISPQVSGMISKVNITNNQRVKKDDILFSIDKTPFLINVESAKANLNNTINTIKSYKAGYFAHMAEFEGIRADLTYNKKQFERAADLKSKNAISDAEYDAIKLTYDNSIQNLKNIEEIIKQQLANLDGNIDLPIEQHSAYLHSKTILDKANFDLNNTDIRAPYDGIAANLYLKEGTFASQGIPLFSFIDNNDIWIEANYKETELTNIKVGQWAKIKIDTYPGKAWKAKVSSITKATGSQFSILPAQNSSGNWVKVTQRIMVRLSFADYKNDVPLSSGMSADVTIDIKSH